MRNKKSNLVKWIVGVVVLVGLSFFIYTKFIKSEKEDINVDPPKLETEIIPSDSLKQLRDDFEHDRSIWSQQKEDLLSEQRKMSHTINGLKRNRKANNDNIKDNDLVSSIDGSLIELKKRGYE